MSNDIAFSDQQVKQLKGLFDEQRQQFEELLDERFEAQDARIINELDRRFTEEREITKKLIDDRFVEERSVTRQIIQTELIEIRQRLDKLYERSENDAIAAIEEIETLKKRLAALELKIAKLRPV